MNRRFLYWSLQLGGWGLQAALNCLFTWLSTPRLFGRSVLVFGWCALCGIALSHVFRAFMRERRWLALPISRSVWRYLSASLVLAVTQSFLAALAYRLLLAPRTFQDLSWAPFAITIWTITFILWIAIYTSSAHARRAQISERLRLETELSAKDAQLKTLLQQVNPHFLFNSLNSIRALIYEDPPKAGKMVDELAGLLRYSLQSEERLTVPLAAELEAVQKYLSIERIRFEDRLHVEIDIHPGARAASVPPMLLQTLVENAVKHGIERSDTSGTIAISACLTQDLLHLTVSNPGSLSPVPGSTRIGLTNATQRLALLGGAKASLTLTEKDTLVCADVLIPQEGTYAGAHRR